MITHVVSGSLTKCHEEQLEVIDLIDSLVLGKHVGTSRFSLPGDVIWMYAFRLTTGTS